MACASCMKAKAQSMRQQGAAAARALATTPVGYSADRPVVLGEEDGAPARRVRVARAVAPLRIQQAAWVTGTGVDVLLEDGSLHLIGDRPQRRRMWKVGVATFTDETEAMQAAEKLGLNAVEIA